MILVYHAYSKDPGVEGWIRRAHERYDAAEVPRDAERWISRAETEEDTLRALHARALRSDAPRTPVLYWHTKGITRPYSMPVADWRELLSYWCVDRWHDAVQMLYRADVVGANLAASPEWHFSGNFWWTTLGHLSKLGELRHGLPRFAAEAWVATGRPARLGSLFDSKVNHYEVRFTPDRYYGRAAARRIETTT